LSWLDTRTVMFSHLVSGLLCVLVLVLLWRQNRGRYPGLAAWAYGFVLQSLGTVLLIFRGAIPDWASITAANVLMIGGAVLVVNGIRLFLGRTGFPAIAGGLLAAFTVSHAYFTYLQPSLAARTIVISLTLGGLGAWGASLAWGRSPAVVGRIMRWVGYVYAALAVSSVIRLLGVLEGSVPNNDFFRTGVFDTLMLMTYQMILVLNTFALALLVNARLIADERLQEEKFAKAFRSSPYALILTRAEDGRILDVNDGFVRIAGYQAAEAVGATTMALCLWESDEVRAGVVRELAAHGSVRDVEAHFRRKTGERIVGLFSAEMISIGGLSHILSSISDITERKAAEEALAQSVREKELLMRELQHRVKNSLTVVSSLIGLSREPITDPGVRTALADLKTRIASVSSVYEQLDRTGRADIIHLRDYILDLVASLTRSYGPPDGHVRVETALEDLTLATKRALPLGLILNELIINAFKYAYPDGKPGEIRVALSSCGEKPCLSVSDDGVGLAEGKAATGREEGTGSKIIALLADQIDAKVTRVSGPGTTVTVEF
jgi:PAS domain S-box-containing protein